MCNIQIETIKSFIDILSALLTPTVAICTAWFIREQKNIQFKQQQTELLKLRIEHIRNVFDTWGNFHKNINYIKDYKAELFVPYGKNYEEVIYELEIIRADLYKYNLSTKYLFTDEIYKLEYEIIKSLSNFIPSRGTPFSIYHIPLKEYTQNREMFNDLYKKYEEIMDKENKLCK